MPYSSDVLCALGHTQPLIAGVLPESVGPYIALMVLGFFVGGYGHLMRSKVVIAIGVAMIFLATVLLPLALNVLNESPAPPGPNIYGP